MCFRSNKYIMYNESKLITNTHFKHKHFELRIIIINMSKCIYIIINLHEIKKLK